MFHNRSKFIAEIVPVILYSFAFFSFSLPFVKIGVGDVSIGINGFEIAFGQRVNEDSNVFWLILFDLLLVFAFFIFDLVKLIIGLTSGIKNSSKIKLVSKKEIIILGLYILYSLIPFIFGVCSPVFAGYNDNPLVSIGSGAILSGVCFFFASIMSLINSLIHDSNNKCDDIKKKPELELIHESTNAVGSKEEKIVSSETKNNNDVGQMNNLKQVNNVKKDVYALITRKYFGRNELNETISLEAGEKVKVLNKNSDSTFDIEYGKNKVIKGVNSFYLNIINE